LRSKPCPAIRWAVTPIGLRTRRGDSLNQTGQQFHLVNTRTFLTLANEHLSATVSDATVDEASRFDGVTQEEAVAITLKTLRTLLGPNLSAQWGEAGEKLRFATWNNPGLTTQLSESTDRLRLALLGNPAVTAQWGEAGEKLRLGVVSNPALAAYQGGILGTELGPAASNLVSAVTSPRLQQRQQSSPPQVNDPVTTEAASKKSPARRTPTKKATAKKATAKKTTKSSKDRPR
ncbi:hypothetical protein ACW9HD_38215, partial [Nocardia gipuzkoensis]